jgi:hypothetical protein
VQVSSWKSAGVAAVGVLCIAIFLSAAPALPPLQTAQVAQSAARQIALSVDPDQSKIDWHVDSSLHDVHGTFRLKRGSLHIVPDTG